MYRRWFLTAAIILLKCVCLSAGTCVAFLVAMTLGGIMAVKPSGECGLPFLVPMLVGGLGGLLAFGIGVAATGPVQRVCGRPFALIVFVTPFVLLLFARPEIQIGLELVSGALSIGIVCGTFGGLLGRVMRWTGWRGRTPLDSSDT